MNKSIEAIVELAYSDITAPWPTATEYSDVFMRVFPGLSRDEIGTLILSACLYNHTEIQPTVGDTLRAFMEKDGFILPGGLRFLEDSQSKIIPGCCSGLERWREWLNVPHGKNTVWAGHDPYPQVEYIENGVRIWQDQKAEGVTFIDLGLSEMEALLQKVALDLQGFLVQLKQWVAYLSPGLERKFVAYFAENMNIKNVT